MVGITLSIVITFSADPHNVCDIKYELWYMLLTHTNLLMGLILVSNSGFFFCNHTDDKPGYKFRESSSCIIV